MTSASRVGRVAALGAVLGAIVLVAVIFFGSKGGGYEVRARFLNANQLVKGNNVQVGGVAAGSVKDIAITPNGLAEIKLKINDRYAPLPQGTRAVIRQVSQSSIAGRYVDLLIPGRPGLKGLNPSAQGGSSGAIGGVEGSGTAERHRGQRTGAAIPNHGLIDVDQTTTSVDLDQLFNTLNRPTRKSLQNFFKGAATQYEGRGAQANLGFHYLNPALSSASRLFNELNRDTPALERFLVESSRLVTALAERRDDLAALIGNLNATFRAIASQSGALAELLVRFPPFMRRANTTFVNLRGALDDVDPLVNASKPVARRLRVFLPLLRGFAHDARPTIRDLSNIVSKPGADNDLIELTRTFGPLEDIAIDRARRNGKVRDGAFSEIARATEKSAPIIAYGRPYTVDFAGWWDDFSNTGGYDALGGISRTQTYFNAFENQSSLNPSAAGACNSARAALNAIIPGTADDIAATVCPLIGPALGLRGEVFKQLARTNQFKRCPGGAELVAPDSSNVFPSAPPRTVGDSETVNRDLDGDGKADCREEDRATRP